MDIGQLFNKACLDVAHITEEIKSNLSIGSQKSFQEMDDGLKKFADETQTNMKISAIELLKHMSDGFNGFVDGMKINTQNFIRDADKMVGDMFEKMGILEEEIDKHEDIVPGNRQGSEKEENEEENENMEKIQMQLYITGLEEINRLLLERIGDLTRKLQKSEQENRANKVLAEELLEENADLKKNMYGFNGLVRVNV